MSQINTAYRQIVYQTAITVNNNAGADQLSSAFSSQTRWIRLGCSDAFAINAGVRYNIGDGTPATTTYSILPPGWFEYIAVQAGQKVALKSNHATATPIVSITELA